MRGGLTEIEKAHLAKIDALMDECIRKMEEDKENKYFDQYWSIWKRLFKEWEELYFKR